MSLTSYRAAPPREKRNSRVRAQQPTAALHIILFDDRDEEKLSFAGLAATYSPKP
jgi:hypothetical protein